ncbi:MAG: flagellar assembly peptidoglycan hydrolase FlgJ [Pseudomonadota bacterium]|nr:flagellar assembly peptidoglycan hydrolase FlgJ [Rubrivivax sp.]MCA3257837.1 flagellar assembly peptidoglycan hydrolase FlgJ [Rubrivivax sp.]MCZ8030539.1 flagellar assembly peptidoglycan hydrolase FlgJ [Rubrivivax sp.]
MAAPPSSAIGFDLRALQGLQARAATDPKAAVREAARQFEALFMQELVKSMRATTLEQSLPGEGALAGSMLDQQFATQLAGLPGGLSEAIQKQLERQMGLAPGPIPATPRAAEPAVLPESKPTRIPQRGAAGFIEQHSAAARAAERQTGIPASFMVAQAALETGWGRKEINHADGSPSYNLFGIKAGPGWRGAVAEVTTTEFVGGKPQKVVARFRAYGSHAESFADYARLMKDSPRYQPVLAAAGSATGFAEGLQKAGYATDPAYADKLGRVINTTLRLQRSLQV